MGRLMRPGGWPGSGTSCTSPSACAATRCSTWRTRWPARRSGCAGRWTWLVIAAYVQLHLARDLADDIRLPWQQPCAPGRLTPSRVRRGYRRIRQDLPVPASAPKPSRPGPGRPKGTKNQRPATRHDVGKTVKREEPKKKTRGEAP